MKKILLLFAFAGIISLLSAQEMVTIHQNGHDFQVSAVRSVNDFPASNIQFWVGNGSNSIVAVFEWCQDQTMGVAYGFRWDGTATVGDLLTAIDAADSRFTVTLSGTMVNTYSYLDGTYDEYLESPGWLMYTINGNYCSGLSDALVNNGYFEMTEYGDCTFTASTPIIAATDPNAIPEEATIDFNDILFWVGEGSNEAVMAVNWADTALAWGYRWNGTATVTDMMNHIAAADPRFSIELGSWGLDDILFVIADGDTLRKAAFSYWESKNNGVMDMGLGQTLANGDLEKWAEPAAGIIVDSTYDATYGYWWYTYVYPMTIHPVTVPDTTGGGVTPPDPEHGPFCGAVGTEGCNAIAANDNQFVAWATGVVLTRGPQMITNPDGPFASFGGDTNAIGPATMDNTMDAVSLGDGGSALVTFERPIRNGEGPDFAVFENSFNDSFLELAFVEVSSDGEHFVRFPATSLTPTDEQVSGAVGGVDPTFINNLAGKFRIGYGTPFDLEELAGSENLNIDSIVYVRIIDAIGTIDPQYATYDAYGHIVNDPWPTNFHSSGYDLTGVGVIHQLPVGIEDRDVTRITVYPNPCNDRIYVNLDEVQKVELYNMNGQLLEMIQPNDTHFMLDMQQYPAGLYLLKVGNGVQKIMKK
ncbi:MAG: T9SS type A sorting domain-containing protein [Bacteroidales bacterium]|nr:T9SS type A sorting domain-containing protein [Bacteroidales bacterium]